MNTLSLTIYKKRPLSSYDTQDIELEFHQSHSSFRFRFRFRLFIHEISIYHHVTCKQTTHKEHCHWIYKWQEILNGIQPVSRCLKTTCTNLQRSRLVSLTSTLKDKTANKINGNDTNPENV